MTSSVFLGCKMVVTTAGIACSNTNLTHTGQNTVSYFMSPLFRSKNILHVPFTWLLISYYPDLDGTSKPLCGTSKGCSLLPHPNDWQRLGFIGSVNLGGGKIISLLLNSNSNLAFPLNKNVSNKSVKLVYLWLYHQKKSEIFSYHIIIAGIPQYYLLLSLPWNYNF